MVELDDGPLESNAGLVEYLMLDCLTLHINQKIKINIKNLGVVWIKELYLNYF